MVTPIRCLSLTEPWASLVACGKKAVETRSWRTKYRGPVAIHAARGMPRTAQDAFRSEAIRRALGPCDFVNPDDFDRTRGRIVAITSIEDVLSTDDAAALQALWARCPAPDEEPCFGNYDPGRYAWVLGPVHRIADGPLVTGALGLWTWTPPEGWEIFPTGQNGI